MVRPDELPTSQPNLPVRPVRLVLLLSAGHRI